MIDPPPEQVTWYYGQWQSAYENLDIPKDPATRNDFVNDIVNDAGVFHRRRWNSTIVTISSKLDMLTFDRR